MKDVLKVLGTYFALGFGTITVIGAGMKVCKKMLSEDTKTNKKDNIIKMKKDES